VILSKIHPLCFKTADYNFGTFPGHRITPISGSYITIRHETYLASKLEGNTEIPRPHGCVLTAMRKLAARDSGINLDAGRRSERLSDSVTGIGLRTRATTHIEFYNYGETRKQG
jgi:hypothetical protein